MELLTTLWFASALGAASFFVCGVATHVAIARTRRRDDVLDREAPALDPGQAAAEASMVRATADARAHAERAGHEARAQAERAADAEACARAQAERASAAEASAQAQAERASAAEATAKAQAERASAAQADARKQAERAAAADAAARTQQARLQQLEQLAAQKETEAQKERERARALEDELRRVRSTGKRVELELAEVKRAVAAATPAPRPKVPRPTEQDTVEGNLAAHLACLATECGYDVVVLSDAQGLLLAGVGDEQVQGTIAALSSVARELTTRAAEFVALQPVSLEVAADDGRRLRIRLFQWEQESIALASFGAGGVESSGEEESVITMFPALMAAS